MNYSEAITAMERVREDKVQQIDLMTGIIVAPNTSEERRALLKVGRERRHEELAAIDMALDLMVKAPIGKVK